MCSNMYTNYIENIFNIIYQGLIEARLGPSQKNSGLFDDQKKKFF